MAEYNAKVDGMMCEHCELNLVSSVKKAFGMNVREVRCSHVLGTCTIKTVLPVKEEKIRQTVEDAGFVYGGLV